MQFSILRFDSVHVINGVRCLTWRHNVGIELNSDAARLIKSCLQKANEIVLRRYRRFIFGDGLNFDYETLIGIRSQVIGGAKASIIRLRRVTGRAIHKNEGVQKEYW